MSHLRQAEGKKEVGGFRSTGHSGSQLLVHCDVIIY